jgi:hypothetical protein
LPCHGWRRVKASKTLAGGLHPATAGARRQWLQEQWHVAQCGELLWPCTLTGVGGVGARVSFGPILLDFWPVGLVLD